MRIELIAGAGYLAATEAWGQQKGACDGSAYDYVAVQTTPFDVVKTRLQTSGEGVALRYSLCKALKNLQANVSLLHAGPSASHRNPFNMYLVISADVQHVFILL